MGSQMIDGIGSIQFRNPRNGLIASGFANVRLSPSVSSAKARRRNSAGELAVSDSRITSKEFTLEVDSETIDEKVLELASNYVGRTTASMPYYELITVKVPTTAPYTVSVATLITTAKGNASSVLATMDENGTWSLTAGERIPLSLDIVTGTTADPGEMAIDVTTPGSEILTFNAGQAGAVVNVSYLEIAENVRSYGKELDTILVGTSYFSAKLISDEFPRGLILICPSVSPNSSLSYDSGADVPTITGGFDVGLASGEFANFHAFQLNPS